MALGYGFEGDRGAGLFRIEHNPEVVITAAQSKWTNGILNAVRNEKPVGQQAVSMEVKIESPAESLYKGDRTGLTVIDAERPASPALPGKERAQVGEDQRTEEFAIDS